MQARSTALKNVQKTNFKNVDFDAISIKIASPEKIEEWSHGEVLKPETINYRTQKPERDGLFCERIFGPTKDWECYCGKYKKIRYKGVVCDKCGVEVTRSSVRRERMGHINLVSPVAHIWYVRGASSILSTVLGISVTDLEKIIYFANFIILDVDENIKQETLLQLDEEYKTLKKNADPLKTAQIEAIYKKNKQEILNLLPTKILSESIYHEISLKYGQIVRVGIGAEAIYEILIKMNVEEEKQTLKVQIENGSSSNLRRLIKRYRTLCNLTKANILPSSLILTKLPVIPPDLRPMVQLDGGRYAASDLNDLYRRVINRNNRLKKLISQGAPEVICRNEKRMLQEAVDALIDNNARRGKNAAQTANARKLRSLSDMLRGKQGRFRQNLLGKRVDYSARSVIVVGPDLKLHQCGLPKTIALELFKPFVVSKLISEGYIHNVKNANRIIEQGTPEVWDILERVTKNSYVLLNRAPTLHRLGIQAFQPVLIEGKAIQIHPLVCMAFNADFDGDQMAIHLPLSQQANWEATHLIRSSNNLMKPASGEPIVAPRQDMVLGCYYMTVFLPGAMGEGKIFSSKNEAILAYQNDLINLRAKIKVRLQSKSQQPNQLVETCIGRLLFNNVLPKELRFVNEPLNSKALKKIVGSCFDLFGVEETAKLVDRIKEIGFRHATSSGMTISISDVNVPREKPAIIKKSENKLEEIGSQYNQGLISSSEKSIKTIELWLRTKEEIEANMIADFAKNTTIYMSVDSGARGSMAQLTQMAGMKGSVINPAGRIIEVPVKANFKEGLSVLEYFISTHGARKGRSDTALRTSDAGYLTRRLVDVAQDVITQIVDCQSNEGLTIKRTDIEARGQKYSDKIFGRIAAQSIVDPKTGKTIVLAGDEISESVVLMIDKAKINEVKVRSVLFCKCTWGICQKCYGRDLSSGKLVKQGEAVGIMAAQAIGEPGTQLTLKTFHMGGVSGEDITSGLPRVEELFEARSPKTPAIMAEHDGIVRINEDKNIRTIQIVSQQIINEEYILPKNYSPVIKRGDFVKAKQSIATSPSKKAIRSKISGTVQIIKNKIVVTSKENIVSSQIVSLNLGLKVKNEDQVKKGDILSEGHLDLNKSLEIKGKHFTQQYIISNIEEIYASQGQDINEKHVEIILKQMFSKVYINDPGDSTYMIGQIVDKYKVVGKNQILIKMKKRPIVFKDIILGMTRVSLKTDSFLSAASFQETTGVLIEAAARGEVDNLRGLKENVIIGKLIPAGTGYKKN